MKRMFLIVAITLLSSTAHAGFLLEPYVGYLFGKTNPGGHTVQGAEYGGRLGFQGLAFMAGGEYMTGSLTTQTTSSTYIPTNLGGFLGYNFPASVRAWVTYFFSTERKSGNTTTTGGNGLKIGLGMKMAEIVSVNIEYYSTNNSNNSTTEQMFGVSASFPFVF